MPKDKVLVPGVVTHASNIVEHPELIAERIMRFANLVGRENVIAGADCGFSSQALYTTEVHPTVIWEKFKAMREGAEIATRKLWAKRGGASRKKASRLVKPAKKKPIKARSRHAREERSIAYLSGSRLRALRRRRLAPPMPSRSVSSARSAVRRRPSATTCAMGSISGYGISGGRMAGRPVGVIYEDDTSKPEVGKQKTDKLIESDHVNFLTGYGFSNVLLASLFLGDAETFIVGANAGPRRSRANDVRRIFFSTSWQGDQAAQATASTSIRRASGHCSLSIPAMPPAKSRHRRESELRG